MNKRDILLVTFLLLLFGAIVSFPACLPLVLDGCESDNIHACSYACDKASRAMLRYNKTEGCICEAPKGAEGSPPPK